MHCPLDVTELSTNNNNLSLACVLHVIDWHGFGQRLRGQI